MMQSEKTQLSSYSKTFIKNSQAKMITVLGPTASGKTAFASRLALHLNAEIISADSRQIYEGMDIGTGKDIHEYTINDVSIPFHLIDIRKAGEKYTLFNFQNDFHSVYNVIQEREKNVVFCGGTGLYIESILKGYKLPDVPENRELRNKLEDKSLTELAFLLSTYKKLHNTTDTDTKKRAIRAIEIAEYQKTQGALHLSYPPIESLIFGIQIDRFTRRKNISDRLMARLNAGLVDEVKGLLENGLEPEDLIYYGLEYKYVTLYVLKQLTFDEMYRQLETAIHQFAKRQMTWFRGMEKRGFFIHWIDYNATLEEKVDKAIKIIQAHKI